MEEIIPTGLYYYTSDGEAEGGRKDAYLRCTCARRIRSVRAENPGEIP